MCFVGVQGQQKGDIWHKSSINEILNLTEMSLNLFCREASHQYSSFSKKLSVSAQSFV